MKDELRNYDYVMGGVTIDYPSGNTLSYCPAYYKSIVRFYDEGELRLISRLFSA